MDPRSVQLLVCGVVYLLLRVIRLLFLLYYSCFRQCPLIFFPLFFPIPLLCAFVLFNLLKSCWSSHPLFVFIQDAMPMKAVLEYFQYTLHRAGFFHCHRPSFQRLLRVCAPIEGFFLRLGRRYSYFGHKMGIRRLVCGVWLWGWLFISCVCRSLFSVCVWMCMCVCAYIYIYIYVRVCALRRHFSNIYIYIYYCSSFQCPSFYAPLWSSYDWPFSLSLETWLALLLSHHHVEIDIAANMLHSYVKSSITQLVWICWISFQVIWILSDFALFSFLILNPQKHVWMNLLTIT